MSSRRSLPSLLLLITAAPAAAQIAKPGFETPATASGALNIVGGAPLTFNAHSGLNAVDLTGSFNRGLTSGVQQSVVTTVGTSYNLSFWLGRAAGGSNYAIPATLDLSVNGGARVSFTNANSTTNAINWQQFTYTFAATSASTLVTFYNGTTSSSINYVGLDDVSIAAVTSTVPEPVTLALVGGGLGLVGFVARRRRATA